MKSLENIMSKGSSWMKGKLAKMASLPYREKFGQGGEGSKPCFKRHETIGAANAARTHTARLVDEYLRNGGKVTRISCTGQSPSQRKKATVCLGDTSPGRAVLRYGRHYLAG